MRTRHRGALAAAASLLAGAALLLPPSTASASTATTDDFGQHVRQCAQTMGFSRAHNPGMHHGAAGWDRKPCEQ